MFDVKWIREHPEVFDRGLVRRGMDPLSEQVIALDDARKHAVAALQDLQTRRNEESKKIGEIKKSGGDASDVMAEVARLKDAMGGAEEEERAADEALKSFVLGLPNHLADDVPDGLDEADNVELHRVGEPNAFFFDPKSHEDIGRGLDGMDFEQAAVVSGSRFVFLKGQVARLSRALGQFMIDLQTQEHGYTEVNSPVLVREQALYGTGQLPKFAEDSYRTTEGHWLIPTAEVTLTNMVSGQILDASDLPIRLTALTQCFRSEAGASGKDTRGMIRQHQFEKVEMVSITEPDASDDELERKLGCAEEVLKRLDLPYRVVRLCAGDMGATMRKTYDVEVWLPEQNTYREISSCSSAGDYQARRMNARFRPAGEKHPAFIHTLNGSGLAVGRTLIAVMENFQDEAGAIAVPEALKPYMGGLERLEPQA